MALERILKVIGEPIELPGSELFVAAEKFVVGIRGEVPISFVGPTFEKHLLGVVE